MPSTDSNFADLLERALKVILANEERTRTDHLGLRSVAARLDCSVDYVRKHLDMFPNAWRADGGELRIPVGDIERAAKARRLRKPETTIKDLIANEKR